MRTDGAVAAGQGICAHVDLAAFADGIASVSLGAAVVMDFAHVADGRSAAVLLRPGDLLTLHGEARYDWTHGCAPVVVGAARCACAAGLTPRLCACSIAAREADEWEGAALPRGHRVSLTLRRMTHDVHVLTEPADAAERSARQAQP